MQKHQGMGMQSSGTQAGKDKAQPQEPHNH